MVKDNILGYIARRSRPAVCGVTEKEATIPRAMKGKAIHALRKSGKRVLGTSLNGSPNVKIWYTGRIHL